MKKLDLVFQIIFKKGVYQMKKVILLNLLTLMLHI